MCLVSMWMSVVFIVALQYWIVGTSSQLNYAERGVDIESRPRRGDKGSTIPQEAITPYGVVTNLDENLIEP